jgi:hypothetical protein
LTVGQAADIFVAKRDNGSQLDGGRDRADVKQFADPRYAQAGGCGGLANSGSEVGVLRVDGNLAGKVYAPVQENRGLEISPDAKETLADRHVDPVNR